MKVVLTSHIRNFWQHNTTTYEGMKISLPLAAGTWYRSIVHKSTRRETKITIHHLMYFIWHQAGSLSVEYISYTYTSLPLLIRREWLTQKNTKKKRKANTPYKKYTWYLVYICLLYTSDAADE